MSKATKSIGESMMVTNVELAEEVNEKRKKTRFLKKH